MPEPMSQGDYNNKPKKDPFEFIVLVFVIFCIGAAIVMVYNLVAR